jgi:hypothetical protein
MFRSMRPSSILAAAWAALATFPTPVAAAPAPDFHLVDLNSGSGRYRATISPRDYRLQVSAFYFGEAG